MEEQRFLIQGRTYTSRDPALQDALARVYDTAERPRCMCVRGGIEMYVAKHRLYVVKRMPDTGAPTPCDVCFVRTRARSIRVGGADG